MRVAVTGASGFVGGAVARGLADRGHEVVGFGRAEQQPEWRWQGDYRRWDIATGPLADAPRVDAVVHCAAIADDWIPLATARAVNVEGTRYVLASFPRARFVHLSTSSVYDARSASVLVREDAALPSDHLSTYSATKAEAEALFAGRDAAVLRPHAVYGPGDTTLLPRVLAGVRGGRLVLPEGARVRHTLTHIETLVEAVALAAQPGAASGIFNIGDAEPVILADVLRSVLDQKGQRDVAIRSIPYRAAFAVAGALEFVHRVGGRPRLTRYAVSQLGLERTLDLSAARRELGFDPLPTNLEGAETW